ncbi:TPA: LamG domain-containing protein [Klebsiella pneumoniae]|nr:hypothetical protein [Klebsiella pneumoniae]HBX8045695.1 LamG domain-containing protein [Klebsiella pneumoniae]HCD7326470.1 hypothetical protein [Klebsiella pneumoniae]
MALLINNIAMSDPGDAPYVPNLLKGLFLNFNAALDAPGNGAQVGTIIMRGNAPLEADRSFGSLRGSGTHKPVSVGGSTPYLEFNGSATLANANTSAGTTLVSGVFTVGIRVRIHDWATLSGNNGLFRGVVSRTAAMRGTGVAGVISVSGGASNPSYVEITTDIAADQWATILTIWDDTNGDKILAGSAGITPISIPSGGSIQGLGFGASINTTDTGANFDMSHFAVWNRALSDDEMFSVKNTWNAWGDIQL